MKKSDWPIAKGSMEDEMQRLQSCSHEQNQICLDSGQSMLFLQSAHPDQTEQSAQAGPAQHPNLIQSARHSEEAKRMVHSTHLQKSKHSTSSGRKALAALTALWALLGAVPALAYFSVVNTGEVIEPQKFQAIVEPQLVLSKFDGLNVLGRFDTGLTESSSVRGILGFGKVDFQLGGLYKLIPFPDTPGQPAIGAEGGLIFARVAGTTEMSLRLHPLISKRFETEIGDLVAYSSLPLGVTFRDGETVVPVQFVVGSELRPLDMSNLSLFAEVGFNLDKAFSYISAAIAFRFDGGALRPTTN